MDTAKKTGRDAAKTDFKRVVRKTAEATEDLIGNKKTDKVTSAGKSKNIGKEEDNEVNKMQEIYILPEKRQQIIDYLRFFQALCKNGIPKNYKPMLVKYQNVLLKNGYKFMINPTMQMINTNRTNK